MGFIWAIHAVVLLLVAFLAFLDLSFVVSVILSFFCCWLPPRCLQFFMSFRRWVRVSFVHYVVRSSVLYCVRSSFFSLHPSFCREVVLSALVGFFQYCGLLVIMSGVRSLLWYFVVSFFLHSTTISLVRSYLRSFGQFVRRSCCRAGVRSWCLSAVLLFVRLTVRCLFRCVMWSRCFLSIVRTSFRVFSLTWFPSLLRLAWRSLRSFLFARCDASFMALCAAIRRSYDVGVLGINFLVMAIFRSWFR